MPQTVSMQEMMTGVAEMDMLHGEMLSDLMQAACAPDKEFAVAYCKLVAAVEQAFDAEEQRMEKLAYEALNSHREQHARVLSALHHVHSSVLGGDLAVGREVVDHLLPQWLSFHASTMDVALALAMQLDHRDSDQERNRSSKHEHAVFY
jgi:hemerythrin